MESRSTNDRRLSEISQHKGDEEILQNSGDDMKPEIKVIPRSQTTIANLMQQEEVKSN